MDYQGNYFPDEQGEPIPKPLRIVKGIFKWTMYGISFIIYILIFCMLIFNRDSKILEKNYMAELDEFQSDAESTELYRINTKIFMNEDGSLQLHNVDYSDEFGIIEIGIKYNAKKLTDNNKKDALTFSLTDTNGNEYQLAKIVSDSGGRYGFSRVSFIGIDIDLDSNDLRYDPKSGVSRTNTLYKLNVYRKSDGQLLYEFDLYDNSVTFTRTEYND